MIDPIDHEELEPTIGRLHSGGYATEREPLSLDEELNGTPRPRTPGLFAPGPGEPATPRRNVHRRTPR